MISFATAGAFELSERSHELQPMGLVSLGSLAASFGVFWCKNHNQIVTVLLVP